MTIAQDLRTRRKHRGKTPWQLVKTIGRLEREADAAVCQMVAMATEIDGLTADRNQLTHQMQEQAVAHAATVDDLTTERDHLDQQLAALRERFAPELAAEANATAITLPQAVRDTSAIEDQATAPIPVIRPVPLHQAPFASTNPAHVPTRATRH
ncbi:hypothetical protein [Streptomyces sp. SID10815]|uniref:hypothetical protein n=1 Tax=Streptomyces sp. SID10815 TaxID=2706027 RepID=UPI0013CD3ED3|nr:hypothetical protein [Streptomyces sp. SID10815]NEA52352.1 hypothetical protein [Streptomyces sp. SID10815]